LHFNRGEYSLPGYDLILDLAGCHFFEDNLFERFRVFQALGGVEDFDAGESVSGVVIEGNAVFKVLCSNGYFCEEDYRASTSQSLVIFIVGTVTVSTTR